MKNIKSLLIIVLFGVCAIAPIASAQVTTYTNSNDFDNAISWSNQILEWENFNAGSYIFDANAIDEVTFTYSLDNETVVVTDSFDQTTFNGGNALGLTGPDMTFLSGDTIEFSLDSPSSFFGLYVIVSPSDARPGDLKLHFANTEVVNSADPEIVLADGGEAYFLGIVSDSEFGYTNATLETIDPNGVGLFLFNIDDIVYPGCIGNIDLTPHVTLSDFATFSWHWLEMNCQTCGGADFTGDHNVMDDDLQIFTNNWLCQTQQLLPGDYNDLTAEHIQSIDYLLSTQSIDGSDGQDFYPGTFFLYQTNEGRYGKFIVENLEKALGHNLTIAWQTFNADGSIYSSGSGLTIQSTWLCDLDEGLETGVNGADWHWNINDSTTRSLNPYNGSRFVLLYRADAP